MTPFFVSVFCLVSSAQVNPALAKEYYQKGDFEKALVLYEKLLSNLPFAS